MVDSLDGTEVPKMLVFTLDVELLTYHNSYQFRVHNYIGCWLYQTRSVAAAVVVGPISTQGALMNISDS